MARSLTSQMLAAIVATQVEPAIFIELAWPDGTVRAWTGIGPKVWASNTYTGLGDLINISSISERSDGTASGISLTLSGIDPAVISTVLGQHYQNRSAKIWLALLSGETIIADPYMIFSGIMDVATIDSGVDSCTVSMAVESRMIDLQKPRNRRYTHEDQQIDYPGDLGFEYVAALNQERPIQWGQPGGLSLTRAMGSSRISK